MDFAWLRAFLQKKYTGMFIPSLPVKSTIKPANERMLGKFLESLGEGEYLKVGTTEPQGQCHKKGGWREAL